MFKTNQLIEIKFQLFDNSVEIHQVDKTVIKNAVFQVTFFRWIYLLN